MFNSDILLLYLEARVGVTLFKGVFKFHTGDRYKSAVGLCYILVLLTFLQADKL